MVKKVVKKAKKKGSKGGQRFAQKNAIVTVQVNRDAEHTEQIDYEYHVFPSEVPTVPVAVFVHNTRNMGDFNSLKVGVEVSGISVASPKAREDCGKSLMEEALNLTIHFTKRAADRLFNVSV